jgi:hypothetical protein
MIKLKVEDFMRNINYTLQKNNLEEIVYKISIIIIFILSFTFFYSCESKKIVKDWTEEITYELFGRSFILDDEICKYESKRAPNGDGYSIYVFKMANEMIEYIVNNFGDIKNEYPLKSKRRNTWMKEGWKETPFIEYEKTFYDFCIDIEYIYFNESVSVINNVKKAISYFSKIMSKTGSYYSYNYYMPGGKYLGDIDFFVFNINRKILICINHNT